LVAVIDVLPLNGTGDVLHLLAVSVRDHKRRAGKGGRPAANLFAFVSKAAVGLRPTRFGLPGYLRSTKLGTALVATDRPKIMRNA